MTGWDTESGARERLALLVAKGTGVHPQYWGYTPSRDYWYFCGPGASLQREQPIREIPPASESLAVLAERGISPEEAARLIGMALS
jgi:hypothetical protein